MTRQPSRRRRVVFEGRNNEESEGSDLGHGPRPRFYNPRRAILITVAVLLGLIVVAGIGGIVAGQVTLTRRNIDLRPRNIDIWAIYPDGSLRFVTLIYATPAQPEAATGSNPLEAQAAGPLVYSPNDVQSSEVIGGAFVFSEYLPGPGRDSNLFYELVTLMRDSPDAPYGVDVLSTASPYLSSSAGSQTIALGAEPQAYQQAIVAVALPRQAEVIDIPDLQPYRKIRLGAWRVFYFETTTITGSGAIRITYRLPYGTERPELDYMRIDRQR